MALILKTKDMKTIKLMSILALVLFCSCKQNGKNVNPIAQYVLFLSVQDKQGTDRIEGIFDEPDISPDDNFVYGAKPLNSELYEYDLIYPNPCMDPRWASPEYKLKLEIIHAHDRYYLIFNELSVITNCPVADKVTFKLKCPYIFKDDVVHEIVTYWQNSELYLSNGNMECCLNKFIRMEFDGVEFIPIFYDKVEFPVFSGHGVVTVEVE